jgi:hypothetical protein
VSCPEKHKCAASTLQHSSAGKTDLAPQTQKPKSCRTTHLLPRQVPVACYLVPGTWDCVPAARCLVAGLAPGTRCLAHHYITMREYRGDVGTCWTLLMPGCLGGSVSIQPRLEGCWVDLDTGKRLGYGFACSRFMSLTGRTNFAPQKQKQTYAE